jgi:glycosyltransferase involved in cell wall biosynthesis
VATHGRDTRVPPGLRCRRVTPEQARDLSFACAVAVLPRRRPGGFPVKLLNYMEAGRPILAREQVADGLEHDRSAWLLDRDASPAEMAEALRLLARDPARGQRLGRAARERLETHHAWPGLARRTLDLVEAVRGRRA